MSKRTDQKSRSAVLQPEGRDLLGASGGQSGAPGAVGPAYGRLVVVAKDNHVGTRGKVMIKLDPGTVERILTGDEPEGISLAKLRTNLPVVC